MNKMDNLYHIKVLILGNYAVGKTTFMMTYVGQKPYYESKGTIVWDLQLHKMDNSLGQTSI